MTDAEKKLLQAQHRLEEAQARNRVKAYWKKVDKKSAFWAMLVGGLVAAVWHFAGQPFGIVPFWPGCGTGLIVLVVMTLCNGKEVSDDYALYKSRMDAVPAEEL